MADIEMTKLCAQAMGIEFVEAGGQDYLLIAENRVYQPLKNDAQAMALVKKFRPMIFPSADGSRWRVDQTQYSLRVFPSVFNADLNRAIVECVAKMQKEKR